MLPVRSPPLVIKPALAVNAAFAVMGAVLVKVVGELTIKLLLPLMLHSNVMPTKLSHAVAGLGVFVVYFADAYAAH